MTVIFLDRDNKPISGKVSELLLKYSFTDIESGLQKLIAPPDARYMLSPDKPQGNFLQETDTFDTWFSSGQWPLVTLTETEKETRLPTDFMGTLSDILKFWVSRMIMFSLYLENKVPFKNVYLWSMVADAKGVKMSKSKGNVINPINFIDKYGADALRMTLVYGVAPGSKVPLSEDKVKGMRNFSNKIWNIARYVEPLVKDLKGNTYTHDDDDQILKQANYLKAAVSDDLENYRLGMAAERIYVFIWHKFADEYIEKTKHRKEDAAFALIEVLKISLKLLHPFMPFVTEAVWQELQLPGMLITTPWPVKVEDKKSN